MTTVASPIVTCVLRTGGEYAPEHVEALYDQVARHWSGPLTFAVLTDAAPSAFADRPIKVLPLRADYPGWWAKMELFAPWEEFNGIDLLCFDLDTVIVGSLDDLRHPGGLTLLTDFYKVALAQSGLMYLPAAERPAIWQAWSADPERMMRQFRGDGELLDYYWRHRAHRWQVLRPGAVVSYKVHVRQQPGQVVPAGARVVCFHGKPRPWHSPLWKRYVEAAAGKEDSTH